MRNPTLRRTNLCLTGLVGACAAAGMLAGCGDERPERVAVAGQVFIDGKPLTCGTVMLVPAGARPSVGAIDPQGRFTLTCFEGQDGAVVGRHPVQVTANKDVDANTIRWFAPKKYANYRTSGLVADIEGPTDSIRIDLTWDGGAPFTEKIDSVNPESPAW